jgi:hypothetical protein
MDETTQTKEQTIVKICGNCRFHVIDEHGGGRNKCSLLEESERYKFAVNHTCDTINDYGELGFLPDYFHLDGELERLRAEVGSPPVAASEQGDKEPLS